MEPAQQRPAEPETVLSGRPASPVDVAVGVSAMAVGVVVSLARRARPVVEPVARVVLDPPMLPSRLRPRHWLGFLGRRGAGQRASSWQKASRVLDTLVPAVVEEVLRRADLTTMVIKYVDLDSVVARVDLDAAANRIDVNAVVRQVDLDDAANRIDVDAVARRLDLDSVARRLDLEIVLDRLDLTAVVLQRVDLDALVSAILERVDLVGLAEQVIDAVDLPEIIRESTGSMASDTVQGARMQGIAADAAVGRAMDRLLSRRGRRSGELPSQSSPRR